jgi:hypothetical protein
LGAAGTGAGWGAAFGAGEGEKKEKVGFFLGAGAGAFGAGAGFGAGLGLKKEKAGFSFLTGAGAGAGAFLGVGALAGLFPKKELKASVTGSEVSRSGIGGRLSFAGFGVGVGAALGAKRVSVGRAGAGAFFAAGFGAGFGAATFFCVGVFFLSPPKRSARGFVGAAFFAAGLL